MPQNRHQRVTIAVTRLLARRQAWRLAIPTTATQAAQTELASLESRSHTLRGCSHCSVSLGTRLAGACRTRDQHL